MENNVHFAHDHPLIFKESEEIRHRCNACGLYVLSSPCYMCTIQGCNFYLHQACAQLPPESHHYFHNGQLYFPIAKHALVLLAKPRDENCFCGKCGKLCENFIYHCSECEFVLHPLCGFPLDIQIKHTSHPQHPLVIVCKEALLFCDVCGRKHEGYFFSCQKCNFWIHHDCALLPSFVGVQNHQHYLSLVYSAASLLDFYFRSSECLICSKMTISEFGLYYCFTCGVSSHVDCAISQMKDPGEIFHLPTLSIDAFPSSMIRSLAKERAIQERNSTNTLEKYHAHSLVLIDEEDIAQEAVCNACIHPISPPYYRCSARSECNFLLHKFCVDLPLSIKDSIYTSTTGSLVSPRSDEFLSLFECSSCNRYCNGFGYSYSEHDSVVDDLACSFSPRVIEHDSHKQHPLVLTYPDSNMTIWVSCCGKSCRYVYHCGVCNFMIHIDCARLPKIVTHKFDKHPLTLTFAPSSQYQNTDHLCEFCEEDIDSKYWFYHCAECDQSFHVDCIPSVGKFSKIKFGGTVEVPCHEDHPLTLTRMMNLGSQNCGYCHEIIEGFKDGMALHCQDCDFWIHFDCGYRSCGGKVSHPYRRIKYV
ncbi:uncharacterized protein LOC142548222 [Primulina tabacum]|uniref:uncharacterized protein LOC142548222 n=1 Tax=Primulina tabacum TaxID=48773 RepID=UPI003F59BD46